MFRTERFSLILTPTEKEAAKALAEVEGGLSQAALVRRLIRTEAERQGLWPPQRSGPARQEPQPCA